MVWSSDTSEYSRDFDVGLYVMSMSMLMEKYWNTNEIGLKLHLILQSITVVLNNKWKFDEEKLVK